MNRGEPNPISNDRISALYITSDLHCAEYLLPKSAFISLDGRYIRFT